ncbi:predicted protein [Sclerotinia sclerotiorum 1980 UF-70]|uniref:Uncharacterized protein n=1 Tax=Sclerotinia sclerotiorum (strain ATCC 18683 / 1980 / Ss-1) TaxID=665079 RepID=A7F3R7_SCLS1|nr:predicted protein [Sclerotinia sclerotiorum 1980 UF-70]EDN97388.1 predicted protein [Sclerotinia sclerotiorum 1980 UF-70]
MGIILSPRTYSIPPTTFSQENTEPKKLSYVRKKSDGGTSAAELDHLGFTGSKHVPGVLKSGVWGFHVRGKLMFLFGQWMGCFFPRCYPYMVGHFFNAHAAVDGKV